MSKKYEFDKQYFRKLISIGKNIMLNSSIKEEDKLMVAYDMNFIKKVVAGDSLAKEKNEDEENVLDNEIISKWILFLKRIYTQLGEKNINYLIDLSETNIFMGVPYDEDKIVSLEEQEFLTLKTYEKHSKKLLECAQKILSPYPTCQIHEVQNFGHSSYEFYSVLANLPFIVVDPTAGSYILNHEVQHGCEFILDINNNDLYIELGAILFELLNNDMFIEENGFIYAYSYGDRISDNNMFLKDLRVIFKIMKDLAKFNFVVSDEEFEKILDNHLKLTKKRNVKYYLTKEYSIYEIEESLIYLLSHLKAMELREQLRNFKGDKLNVLNKYISKSEVDFNLTENLSYTKDMLMKWSQKLEVTFNFDTFFSFYNVIIEL